MVVSLRLVLMLETTVKWPAMRVARGGRSIPHSFAPVLRRIIPSETTIRACCTAHSGPTGPG